MIDERPSHSKLAKVAFLAHREANVPRFDYFEKMFGRHVQTSVRPASPELVDGTSFEIKGTSIVKLNYDKNERLFSIDWLLPNKNGNHSKFHFENNHASFGEYKPHDARFSDPINSWRIIRAQEDPSDITVQADVTVKEKFAPGVLSPVVDKRYTFSGKSPWTKEVRALRKHGFDPKYVSIMDMLGEHDPKEITSIRQMASVNMFFATLAELSVVTNYTFGTDMPHGILAGLSVFIFANMFRSLNKLYLSDENTANSLEHELKMIRDMGSLDLYLSTLMYHSVDFMRSLDRKVKYAKQSIKASLFGRS